MKRYSVRDNKVGKFMFYLYLVIVLHELKITVKDSTSCNGQSGYRITVRVVELCGLNNQCDRLREFRFRNPGCYVNVARVSVQLEVLVLVADPIEGVEDGSSQA